MGGAENCSWDVMFERIKKKIYPMFSYALEQGLSTCGL